MLPAAHRLRASGDFALVQRRGTRVSRPTFVLCALLRPELPTRVGLSVSKSVGNSVLRHGVSRKLRHLVRPHLLGLPEGTQIVLRALAPSAHTCSDQLGLDLAEALDELTRRGIKS